MGRRGGGRLGRETEEGQEVNGDRIGSGKRAPAPTVVPLSRTFSFRVCIKRVNPLRSR